MKTRFFLAFGFVLLSLLTLLRVVDPPPASAARNAYFDYLQRLAPRAQLDVPVRIVDIDEESLTKLGQWPWPRDLLAVMVENLWDYGAAVVVFDVLFAEPDRLSPARVAAELERRGLADAEAVLGVVARLDNDFRFADAASSRSVVLGTALVTSPAASSIAPKSGFAEIGDRPSLGLPVASGTTPIVEVLAEAASGIGMINVSLAGGATVIRRVPLVWSTDCGLMPSLAVEALRVALDVSTPILVAEPDLPGVVAELRLGELAIPTNALGEIWVHYRPEDPGAYISAHEVISDSLDRRAVDGIAGAIVFVGTSAAGLLDIRTNALGESVPGVSIHAQIVEQALTGHFLRRGALVEAGEILTFVGVGIVLLFAFSSAGPFWALTAGAFTGAALLAASWFLFTTSGLLIDAAFPLAGGLILFTGLTSYQFVVADREKRLIRRSFSHYVSPDVLREIEDRGHELELGGSKREASVLFTDIRNFTSLSEAMDPTDLVSLLNGLFTVLGDEILQQQGTIDKFVGDAVMAFWNAPLEQPDHADRSMRAALGMRRALAGFNEAEAGRHISMATGIATGPVLVGNIGSRRRFNYSVIGDTVNRASRIETACRHVRYDILVSDLSSSGSNDLALLDAGQLTLKGLAGELKAFILVGGRETAASAPFRTLAARHDQLTEAMRSGCGSGAEHLAACRALADTVEPGLIGFYERIMDRAQDFRREPHNSFRHRTLSG